MFFNKKTQETEETHKKIKQCSERIKGHTETIRGIIRDLAIEATPEVVVEEAKKKPNNESNEANVERFSQALKNIGDWRTDGIIN